MDQQNNSQSQDRERSLFGSPPGEASDSSSGGDPRQEDPKQEDPKQEDPKQEDPEGKNPKEKDFEDESRSGGSSSEESSSEDTSQRDVSQGDAPSVDTASVDTSSDSPTEIVQLNVRIPEKLHQKIKIESARRRISIKEFVIEAVQRHLQKHD
jgi:hypothetical protein